MHNRSTKRAAWARRFPVAVPGTGEGIRAGTVGWTTLTLAAGGYELVCNLRNHYANGMHQEFLVI
jgi:hypothetical protein